MTVSVITGGRDRTPTMSELERLLDILDARGITTVRHGACPPRKKDGALVGSTDTAVADYLRARWAGEVEDWPADWDRRGRAAGPIRNRAMCDGRRDGDLLAGPAATCVISFDGGKGTADCQVAGYERGLPVIRIHAVDEPRPWNMHHGTPPGPLVYVGRSAKHGGPSPLANPWPLEVGPGQTRADAAPAALGRYKRWLWERIDPASDGRDAWVSMALAAIKPGDYLGCTCWPHHCHAEVIVAAWRWMQGMDRGEGG